MIRDPEPTAMQPDPLEAPASATEESDAPPPCFHWRTCGRTSATEKAGRSLCAPCATQYKGREYPVRPHSESPLHIAGQDCAAALDMLDHEDRPANEHDRHNKRHRRIKRAKAARRHRRRARPPKTTPSTNATRTTNRPQIIKITTIPQNNHPKNSHPS